MVFGAKKIAVGDKNKCTSGGNSSTICHIYAMRHVALTSFSRTRSVTCKSLGSLNASRSFAQSTSFFYHVCIVHCVYKHTNNYTRNNITYISSNSFDFNQDYLRNTRVQLLRSKIFLLFVDKFALECEWFLHNYVNAKVTKYKCFVNISYFSHIFCVNLLNGLRLQNKNLYKF